MSDNFEFEKWWDDNFDELESHTRSTFSICKIAWDASAKSIKSKLDAQAKNINELKKLAFLISQDETQPRLRREYAKDLFDKGEVKE